MHHDSPARAARAKRPGETSPARHRACSPVINSCAVRLLVLFILFTGVTCATAGGQTPTPTAAPRATPAPRDAGTPASNTNDTPASATQPDNGGGDADAPATTTTTVDQPATNTPAVNLPATAQTSDPTKVSAPLSRVVDVYKLGEEVKPPGDTRTQEQWDYERRQAGLNDIIIIKVANLIDLVNRAKCRGAYAATTCREQEIVLYIEGREIEGLVPESGAPTIEESSAEPGTLRYHLQRSGGSDEHWADLLGFSLDLDEFKLHRDVEVSVGLPGEYPIKSDVKNFHLVRVRLYRLLWWLVLFLILSFYLWRLTRESDFLRDRKPVLWKQRKPYSLGLTQAAWWFVLIIVSFVFIWLVTGQYDLSTSVLVLLGIGFGTALGATVIGENKSATPTDEQNNGSDLRSLLLAKDTMETELTKLELQKNTATEAEKPALATQLAARKEAYNTLIANIRQKFPEALGWGNVNFHIDLVSDSHGVNFHRFQMIVWTIVLGIIFIHSVLSRLSMPQFSTTLLTLMGISSGAYLAGKSSEPQHLTGNAAATPGDQDAGAAGTDAGDASPADPPAQG
ncbi:MAG TPA: hypothetical protein VGB05_03675 [Pyrinomonadaceae bacterium]